jgi:carbon monoxide dehydrogenase subunit G
MDLRHEFTVPASIDQTWSAFNDIESVAVCFPGAKVTAVEGDTFTGTVKVKLGPIALLYNGTGTFVEKDESAHRMVIDAKGKDKRGNGTAGAHVTATMTEQGTSTHVEVLTDLNVTGKPAQFGRGVMEDVSNKLLGQFTTCLEQKVGDSSSEPTDATAAAEEAAPATAPGAEDGTADRRMSNMRSRPREMDMQTETGSDDALDLGATVLPVLAKAYWKQAVGVLLVLWVLRSLLGRRHSG